MGVPVLAEPSLSDAATLTATSAVGSLPVGNLQTSQPGEVWRATALAGAAVEADLGAAAAIGLAALLHTNATAAATWRVRGAADQASLTAAPGYDSGVLPVWPAAGLESWPFVHAIHLPAADQTFRWWRLDLADPGNPDGHLQAGRLYLAAGWRPSRNVRYGWSIGWVDPSERLRSRGGQAWSVRREPWRVLDFTIGFLTEAEAMARAFDLDRRRGMARDVLAIRDPDDAARIVDQTVYGQFSELRPVVNPSFRIFEKRFRIEEMLP